MLRPVLIKWSNLEVTKWFRGNIQNSASSCKMKQGKKEKKKSYNYLGKEAE